jgi:hypothetical protein
MQHTSKPPLMRRLPGHISARDLSLPGGHALANGSSKTNIAKAFIVPYCIVERFGAVQLRLI